MKAQTLRQMAQLGIITQQQKGSETHAALIPPNCQDMEIYDGACLWLSTLESQTDTSISNAGGASENVAFPSAMQVIKRNKNVLKQKALQTGYEMIGQCDKVMRERSLDWRSTEKSEWFTCQASSSCDSSSLRWMASSNWLLRDIISFLLLTSSSSIRFFLQRSHTKIFKVRILTSITS